MYIVADEAGRICAASEEDCLEGAVFVETPEGFAWENLQDWRLTGGALVHDPQENETESETENETGNETENETENETPTQEERIAALEAANELLTQCLLEMSETLYA